MEKTISRIVEYAGKIADPISIHVFGSMATGSYNQYSDLDLLIVTEHEAPSKQICELVKVYAAQFCLSVDVLVYSTDRLNAAAEQPHSFIASIIKTAKKVYEKP